MSPQAGASGARLRIRMLAGLLGLLLSGCSPALTTTSLRTLPFRERFGNPWGVEANARREGTPPRQTRFAAKMSHWAEFGREWLQDGDILFRLGCSSFISAIDVSRILASVTDSPFSHVGLVCREGDQVWVYDIESSGVHKTPFETWMLDVSHDVLCVKRLREQYRDRIPLALAFCDDIHRARIKFDYHFQLSDDELYCAELVQKAYAAAGLCLCKPVPLRCLPNYQRHRFLAAVLHVVIRLRLDEPAFVPGNASYGLYSSTLLETVYENPEVSNPKRSRHSPPLCGMVPGN